MANIYGIFEKKALNFNNLKIIIFLAQIQRRTIIILLYILNKCLICLFVLCLYFRYLLGNFGKMHHKEVCKETEKYKLRLFLRILQLSHTFVFWGTFRRSKILIGLSRKSNLIIFVNKLELLNIVN